RASGGPPRRSGHHGSPSSGGRAPEVGRAAARPAPAPAAIPGRLPVSVAAAVPGWYAHVVRPVPVLGDELAGPWFRVQSIVARQGADSAEHDFLDILPAAAAAARAGRAFVAGWVCRAAGAPLEFITNAALPGPEPEPANGCALPGPGPGNGCALLFPPGARGLPDANWYPASEALVWAP